MKTISAKEVQEKIENGEEVHIIDVREADEFQLAHIPGSKNIPLKSFTFHLNELSKDTSYIIVCLSGKKSSQAVSFLEKRGYDAINMSGGMVAWLGAIE